MLPDDDPGWPKSLRMLIFFVPGAGLYRRRLQQREPDGLVLLRQVFLNFAISLTGFGVVLAVLYPGSPPPKDPPSAVVTGLLIVGAIGVALTPRIENELDCTDDFRLAGTYRTRFFLRVAFAEAAALFGFVGFFLTYAWWPYPVGLAIAAVGFARAAPTRRHLELDQDRLSERACFRSLTRALRTAKPPPGPSQ